MGTLRERQRQLREEIILDTAYTLLTERGYDGMTMDELAARVGIAKVTLYQHFASKEALAVGIVVRRMRVLEDELQPIYALPLPAMERLERILQHSLAHNAPKWAANLSVDARILTQDAVFQEIDARLTQQWAELVEQAKAAGAIKRDLSTPVVVRLLRRLFVSGYEDLLADGTVTPEVLGHTLMNVVLEGMRA